MRCTSLSFLFFAPLVYTPAVRLCTCCAFSMQTLRCTCIKDATPAVPFGVSTTFGSSASCTTLRFFKTEKIVHLHTFHLPHRLEASPIRCNSTPWFAIKSSISKTVRRQLYASLHLIHSVPLVPMHRRTGGCAPQVQPKWCGGCAPQVIRAIHLRCKVAAKKM